MSWKQQEIAWSLALGYGVMTAVDALRARQRQLWPDGTMIGEGTIAGMAASAWFLANPRFLQELPIDADYLFVSTLVLALLALFRDDWQMSFSGGVRGGGRFYDRIGADDGFA